MSNSHRIVDSRSSLRIKERLPVKWQLSNSEIGGEGRIVNLSASGMLVETRGAMDPIQNCLLAFQSFITGGDNFIPSSGRLVWAEKRGNKHRWGIEFVNPTADVADRLRDHIQSRVVQWARTQKVRTVVGFVLLAVMLSMTAFVLIQQNLIVRNIDQSGRMAMSALEAQSQLTQRYSYWYQTSQANLAEVTRELTDTKAVLSETEKLLALAQEESQSLKEGVQSLQLEVNLGDNIAQLRAKSSKLNDEFLVLKEQLRVLQGEIATQDEGDAALKFYRDKIKVVKRKMTGLRREAAKQRLAAEKERDRLLLLAGNNGNMVKGYVVKDGKAPEKVDPAKKLINIDVTFF